MTPLGSTTCVVTGATGGIGEAIVRALVDDGARVRAIGRDRDKLAALVGSSPPDAVTAVIADLAVTDDIRRAAQQITTAGEVHVLVHAAGIIRLGPTTVLDGDDLDELYAVNLRAPYVLTRQLLPALRRAGGQVVFVNSSAAVRPVAVNALYASTKAGLKALADGLREEVNEDGVRVVNIYAGRTATNMQVTVHTFEKRVYDEAYLLSPRDVATSVVHCLSMPRTAEVTDIHLRPMRKASPS